MSNDRLRKVKNLHPLARIVTENTTNGGDGVIGYHSGKDLIYTGYGRTSPGLYEYLISNFNEQLEDKKQLKLESYFLVIVI